MKKFSHLYKLLGHIDDAFESFYDDMLKDARLSIFFENEQQIIDLIKKQKVQFVKSLDMNVSMLKSTYIELGEFHYDIKIPYVDFIKGTEILEEHFLLSTQKNESSIELMDEIFEYFKLMKAFTAKGYLNRMIVDDKIDIESFFEQTTVDNNIYFPKTIVLEKIEWLKELLESIENNQDFTIVQDNSLLKNWLDEQQNITLEKRKFFQNLEKRILINTQNLFYFLKREEYLEILPLYTSLLSIYKLTLMMNNAVTIEYANKIIDDMKLDSLTKLFRKDIFEELLKKEMALSKRDKNYSLSIAYLDLDDFKSVNDNFGHYSGDKVVEKLGEIIRENIRASDIGFRIGGDEFAIIFKNATKEQSKYVCQKIKDDFTTYQFIFNNEVTFNVGISMGINEYKNRDTLEDFLQHVDKKLYEAKDKGKNQICI